MTRQHERASLTETSLSEAETKRIPVPGAVFSEMSTVYWGWLKTGVKRLRLTLIVSTTVEERRGVPPSRARSRTCSQPDTRQAKQP